MATGRIGVTPNLGIRWSKVPTGGTTSLSGNDDNSVPLAYSAGYEAVYRNGVLLSRGNDYTATDGTSITLIDATITGDLIEVFANQTVALTDTYSQSAANAKFINNTLTTTTGDIIYASAANTPARLGIGSTGQVLKVSGGLPTWGSDGSLTKITSASFTTQSSVTIDSVFSSTYTRYMMRLRILGSSAGAEPQIQLRYGSTTLTSPYYGSGFSYDRNNGLNTHGFVNTGQFRIDLGLNTVLSEYLVNFGNVGNSAQEAFIWGNGYGDYSNQRITNFAGLAASSQTYTGLVLKPSTGTITGNYVIYGLEN